LLDPDHFPGSLKPEATRRGISLIDPTAMKGRMKRDLVACIGVSRKRLGDESLSDWLLAKGNGSQARVEEKKKKKSILAKY